MNLKSAKSLVYAFFALDAATCFASPILISPTLTTLQTFDNQISGADPSGSLSLDASGNLYGTTVFGPSNYGTVFKVTAGINTLSTLVSFTGLASGQSPYAGLTADAAGNFYGTTTSGGSSNHGTVFRIAAGTNKFSTLVTFNGSNGALPVTGVIADASGNLYGATLDGGSSNDGIVYKIAAGTNTLSTLATFTGTANGEYPRGGLVADASGNLYGTTLQGGPTSNGTVFKISAGTNSLTTLATFADAVNGQDCYASLIVDVTGNLYGTTFTSGSSNDGTVFKLAAGSNTLTTLATFTGTANGANPLAGLIADASGNLYGTTQNGGSDSLGTVFEIAANTNAFTTLVTFDGTDNGANPAGNLIADASGNLYGTTGYGGSTGYGTVFELTGTGFTVPEPTTLTLVSFGCLTLARRRRRCI